MVRTTTKTHIGLSVAGLIYTVRAQKIMIDSDLAQLYGVDTKTLNRAVKRNMSRFPTEFMFQLTEIEDKSLRCQIGTSKGGRGGRRYLPHAFTEHGVVMLSTVLNSERAVQMSLQVVRAFIRMRELLATHKDLATKIEKLEQGHQQTGAIIESLIEDIDKLASDIRWIKNLPLTPKRRMGYIVGGKED